MGSHGKSCDTIILKDVSDMQNNLRDQIMGLRLFKKLHVNSRGSRESRVTGCAQIHEICIV